MNSTGLVDWAEEWDRQGTGDGSVPPEERLDAAIRLALWSAVGEAEPSAVNWTRIWQRVLRSRRRARRRETSRPEACAATMGRSEMLSWIDVLAQQERYADLLREAAKERFLQQVVAGRGMRDRAYRRALAWLGHRLVTWGRRLQERYGAAAAAVQVSGCQPRLANR